MNDVSPITSWVVMGKPLNATEPQFLICKTGAMTGLITTWIVVRINRIVFEVSARWLAQSKFSALPL